MYVQVETVNAAYDCPNPTSRNTNFFVNLSKGPQDTANGPQPLKMVK